MVNPFFWKDEEIVNKLAFVLTKKVVLGYTYTV